MDQDVPNSTVLCRFRSKLNKHNAFDELLKTINKRMEDGGLMIVKRAILDASATPLTLLKCNIKRLYEKCVSNV